MSSDNEYVAPLKYAICLNVDLSTFPSLWAVLSILLDSQDGNLEYVKFLQEEYNRYYADKSRKYMMNLEMNSTEIQNHMHDSVTHDFYRVSDLNDNGSTPLQGQQDEQPEGVNTAENAIDNDVVDVMTLYPPWSTDTNDRCDNNQVASDRNRKEIQEELYKDTPVKTENNKPYIDNIDAYNRDRALITKSLSDRLGLGQNSFPGAQQVRVAVKHTDQITEIPEHFRQISLGEEIESTSYEEIDRNRNFIPQVDGTVDCRDSLGQTLDSIDLTESPVKHTNTQRHIEKFNEDTSDYDTDEMIDFNKDKTRSIYRKDTNEPRKRVKIVKSKKGRTTKIYAISIERKRFLKQRREKVLQNAKDRKLAKGNHLVALQADQMANRALNDTQSITNTNDEMIDGSNTDAVIGVDNTDNAAIAAENVDNAATDAENTDNAAINADNTRKTATDGEKSDDATMSGNNTDNATISDSNTDNATTDNKNTDNITTGETSTVHIPLPPSYGGKTKDPSKIKTSTQYLQ